MQKPLSAIWNILIEQFSMFMFSYFTLMAMKRT